ncbi:MAG: hypothetical protein KAJ73_04280, partial [Zetaproteobacteria bacterium]|nr:hypothetical protein [Zetaproteobacteria bacterium]
EKEKLLLHIKNHILEIDKKLSITGRNVVYSGRVEGCLVQEEVHLTAYFLFTLHILFICTAFNKPQSPVKRLNLNSRNDEA